MYPLLDMYPSLEVYPPLEIPEWDSGPGGSIFSCDEQHITLRKWTGTQLTGIPYYMPIPGWGTSWPVHSWCPILHAYYSEMGHIKDWYTVDSWHQWTCPVGPGGWGGGFSPNFYIYPFVRQIWKKNWPEDAPKHTIQCSWENLTLAKHAFFRGEILISDRNRSCRKAVLGPKRHPFGRQNVKIGPFCKHGKAKLSWTHPLKWHSCSIPGIGRTPCGGHE